MRGYKREVDSRRSWLFDEDVINLTAEDEGTEDNEHIIRLMSGIPSLTDDGVLLQLRALNNLLDNHRTTIIDVTFVSLGMASYLSDLVTGSASEDICNEAIMCLYLCCRTNDGVKKIVSDTYDMSMPVADAVDRFGSSVAHAGGLLLGEVVNQYDEIALSTICRIIMEGQKNVSREFWVDMAAISLRIMRLARNEHDLTRVIPCYVSMLKEGVYEYVLDGILFLMDYSSIHRRAILMGFAMPCHGNKEPLVIDLLIGCINNWRMVRPEGIATALEILCKLLGSMLGMLPSCANGLVLEAVGGLLNVDNARIQNKAAELLYCLSVGDRSEGLARMQNTDCVTALLGCVKDKPYMCTKYIAIALARIVGKGECEELVSDALLERLADFLEIGDGTVIREIMEAFWMLLKIPSDVMRWRIRQLLEPHLQNEAWWAIVKGNTKCDAISTIVKNELDRQ